MPNPNQREQRLAVGIRQRISKVFLGGLLAGIVGGIFIAPLLWDNSDWIWK